MKPSTLFAGFAATGVLAYPGLDRTLSEIQQRDEGTLQARSTELLGDLLDGVLTDTGNLIKMILEGLPAIADGLTYRAPGPLGSAACQRDTCCVWKWIADDMVDNFRDGSVCTDLARAAIRQGFHDAATWDRASTFGGADGSLLLSNEMTRFENRGLEAIAAQTNAWFSQYQPHGIGMADLIQVAATVATVVCPGGPRIRTFVGRLDSSQAGPTGKLPSPLADAQSLINLFQDKTFTSSDLVALLGAHTVSNQNFLDRNRPDAPQDSTPGVWDTRYYSETLSSDNTTVLVFPSDRNIATFSATRGRWNDFAGPLGRLRWAPAYAQAYFRMSLLGVNNLNRLTECTKVLPLPR